MFADPLTVKCPRCFVESQHNSADLLALVVVCPACGASLDEVGRRMGAGLDETIAFGVWAEVLVGVEDRLGIPSPGIPDGEVFGTKPHVELTLRDLVRTVAGHVLPAAGGSEAASLLVLESATQIAGRPVLASELDRPLLQALRVRHWAGSHAEPDAAPDPAA